MAYGITTLAAILAMCAVVWTCRKTNDPRWRYAVLATVTLLATPYSWYYELALILPAIWFVLERGYRAGWLPYERELVALLFALCVSLPGPQLTAGVSLPFLMMVCASFILLRRVRFELIGPGPSKSTDLNLSAGVAHAAG